MQSIGKIIEIKLREKGISVSEFARRINKNRNNVYDIFRRESLDTQLLQKISQVLDYDFFMHFRKENNSILVEDGGDYGKNETDILQKYNELQKEIVYLKQLIKDKNHIIILLEQRQ